MGVFDIHSKGTLPGQACEPGIVASIVKQRHAVAKVSVSIDRIDHSVSVTIDDDGPGIPLERRVHVLSRFGRTDQGRAADQGGSGLGLAIVDGVMRRHGGSIFIDDSPQGGARVVLTFPHSG